VVAAAWSFTMVGNALRVLIGCLWVLVAVSASAQQAPLKYAAHDTLRHPQDPDPAAQAMLDDLEWAAAAFEVTVERPVAPPPGANDRHFADYDALVRFPSPWDTGHALNDTVVMEWYAARDEANQFIEGPAMIVLHILQNDMTVPRLFARTFARHGIHAFVLHMPHYGRRRGATLTPSIETALEGVRQAIGDARRAKDAVSVLPRIDNKRIGIQGTSLGGFICTGAASLDDAFDPVFPTLCGGDLVKLFANGRKEVAAIRQGASSAGISEQEMNALLQRIDPLMIAHRLDARKTMMFSALGDEVIPADNAKTLAAAFHLPPEQHIWLSGNHVTCAVHLPRITKIMVDRILEP
jgi:dienelactone hydrolase